MRGGEPTLIRVDQRGAGGVDGHPRHEMVPDVLVEQQHGGQAANPLAQNFMIMPNGLCLPSCYRRPLAAVVGNFRWPPLPGEVAGGQEVAWLRATVRIHALEAFVGRSGAVVLTRRIGYVPCRFRDEAGFGSTTGFGRGLRPARPPRRNASRPMLGVNWACGRRRKPHSPGCRQRRPNRSDRVAVWSRSGAPWTMLAHQACAEEHIRFDGGTASSDIQPFGDHGQELQLWDLAADRAGVRRSRLPRRTGRAGERFRVGWHLS